MDCLNLSKGLRIACLTLILAGAGALPTEIFAATAAGTQIKNLATVTYEDAAGNIFTAQSNESVVTVAQVYSASLGVDLSVNSAPGQPVYLPFLLENTGNGADTYELAVIEAITGGDSLNADSIKIYDDVNGDGEASAGEPEISVVTLAASAPGNLKSIVVEVLVPSTAQSGDTLGLTLTALAHEGTGAGVAGSVTDNTVGGGLDGLDSTNEAMITVSGNAIIVATKQASYNDALSQITYEIKVRNNGNSDAQNVVVNDAIPANTTYVAGSATAAGLLTSNGDTLPTLTTLNEVNDGVDYNADGDMTDTSVQGLSAIDVLLGGSEILLTYTVEFDPDAVQGGEVISNIAYVIPDVDGDGIADTPVATNTAFSAINNTNGVEVTDTAENTGGDQINDGQDDDGLNDVQFVDTTTAGATVIFKGRITNTGNSDDIIELSVANSGTLPFPQGTVFTLWDDTGLIMLTDTNSFQGVDTGLLGAGEFKNITIKASLPASVSGITGFEAGLQVTSSNDSNSTDAITLRLGAITIPSADIHNAAGGTIGTNEDPLGTPDYATTNSVEANVGESVEIPLWIDNASDTPTPFQLSAGSSYDAATNALGNLPAGWTVEYYLTDAAGERTGNAITSTPSLPGFTTDFAIIAVVTAPSDQTMALFDLSYDNDADTVAEVLDGNNDGDGDYPLFFEIRSTATGASDVTLSAVDVNEVYSVTLTPSGSDQIEAGGTAVFQHTLANNGNSDATLELTATNNQPGWTNTVTIDTDGDGIADTELGNLTAGNILVQQPDGSTATIVVTLSASGNPVVTLATGVVLPMTATVFAPASSSQNEVDTMMLSAIDTTSGAVASAQNQSQVVSGKVRVTKTAAIDTDCDHVADSNFVDIQTTAVEPGQCVIWQVVAENQGASDALNVIISDAVPAFTNFLPNSLHYCMTTACTLTPVSDATSDDPGEHTAGNITFYIGTGADAATGTGGVLVAGDQATVRFGATVE